MLGAAWQISNVLSAFSFFGKNVRVHKQSDADPEETEEETVARNKLKVDQAAALDAKKKGNDLYSKKVYRATSTWDTTWHRSKAQLSKNVG